MENDPVEISDALSSIRKPQSLIQRKNGDAVGETNNTDDTMDCYQMLSARDELDDSNSSIPTQNTGNESTRSLEAYLHHGIGFEKESNVEIGTNKGIRRHKSIAGSSNSPILRSRHNSNTSQVESSEENVSVKKVIKSKFFLRNLFLTRLIFTFNPHLFQIHTCQSSRKERN